MSVAPPEVGRAPRFAPSRLLWAGWWLLAGISAAVYYAIHVQSFAFAPATAGSQRPLLLVLNLFAVLFLLYWAALWMAVRLPSSPRLATCIFATALLFRALLLPSIPIQEIDIYRYAWDGAIAHLGSSPYAYAPQDVVLALDASRHGQPVSDPQLAQIVRRVGDDGELEQVVRQVHFGQLPTPYPPVSQLVFRLAASVLPDGCSVGARLTALKCLFLLFDMGTLVLVLLLLARTGRHVGWSLVYGWCPLVIKEFANSGHLDALAIFLTTAALLAAIWPLGWVAPREAQPAGQPAGRRPGCRWWSASIAATLLALAIGAKLYPVVLTPLCAGLWWRQSGWRGASCGLLTFVVGATFCLAPMFRVDATTSGEVATLVDDEAPLAAVESLPPHPSAGHLHGDEVAIAELPAAPTLTTPPTAGLWEFLKRWEMNDLLFLVAVENLRPQADVSPGYRPWFAVVPDAWSRAILQRWSRLVAGSVQVAARRGWIRHAGEGWTADLLDLENNAYIASTLLARALAGGVLMLLTVLVVARRLGGDDSAGAWLRGSYLILVWCWLLAPTQNPWYLCWAIPLLPFARARTWLLLPGVAMLYYLRFWFEYHYPQAPVWGTPYNGAYFFHFVVVWLEFGPWFVLLVMETCLRWRHGGDQGLTRTC